MIVIDRTKIAISALAGFLFLASTAQAQEFMTQKELLATIPGNTIYGISIQDDKTRWIQSYGKGRKKGKIAGVYGKEQYKAKWSVKGNLWCEDWGDGGACWNIERVGAKSLRMYNGGKPQKRLWKLK